MPSIPLVPNFLLIYCKIADLPLALTIEKISCINSVIIIRPSCMPNYASTLSCCQSMCLSDRLSSTTL